MPREIARKVIASFQQPETAAAYLDELRPSERKILELLATGLANKEIADRLGLAAAPFAGIWKTFTENCEFTREPKRR